MRGHAYAYKSVAVLGVRLHSVFCSANPHHHLTLVLFLAASPPFGVLLFVASDATSFHVYLLHLSCLCCSPCLCCLAAAAPDVTFPSQILQLKTMLQEKEGIDVKQIRLIHNGRQLADDKSLESCGVTAGTTLHMVLALRGGL